MPIITLTSDYGNLDHRVPAIKGSILQLNPEARIIDISHEIAPYNLIQCSYIVKNAYSHFPKESIHIISVDSFFHKDRKNLLVKADGHYFISADNGLLSLIFHDIKPEAIYEITINNRFDDEVKFASVDIFAPVAAHLTKGGLPELIGRKIKNYKQISFSKPYFQEAEKMLIGEVMYIDNFGNCVTNITKSLFDKTVVNFSNFEINIRNILLKNIHKKYTDIVTDWQKETDYHGKASALFNEQDLLEITIYKGTKKNGANSLFGLKMGDKIYIQFD
jgi:S-adenosylmethionine hydrolase